jgi:hypothetical protein
MGPRFILVRVFATVYISGLMTEKNVQLSKVDIILRGKIV